MVIVALRILLKTRLGIIIAGRFTKCSCKSDNCVFEGSILTHVCCESFFYYSRNI